jgi:thiamine-monophosphate kinase
MSEGGQDKPGEMPGEFDLIARYFAPLARRVPGALGLKDDVALLDPSPGHQLVVTTDAVVAGIHFLPDDPPGLIAKKLLRVNVSDLAAKGAVPVGCLLALALPRTTTPIWLDSFAAGLAEDCAHFAIPLIGGDTTATDGPLTMALTAFGEVPRGQALLRSGAKVGDRIFVSGTIGDGALGLLVAKGELSALAAPLRDYLLSRYRKPEPRLVLGRTLRGIAHASMDISDGLIADLGHICEASGVAAEIQAAMVPLSDGAQIAVARDPALLSHVLTGGDDYELLFTADPKDSDRIVQAAIGTGVPVTGIGFIGRAPEDRSGGRVKVADLTAVQAVLGVAGYRHF